VKAQVPLPCPPPAVQWARKGSQALFLLSLFPIPSTLLLPPHPSSFGPQFLDFSPLILTQVSPVLRIELDTAGFGRRNLSSRSTSSLFVPPSPPSRTTRPNLLASHPRLFNQPNENCEASRPRTRQHHAQPARLSAFYFALVLENCSIDFFRALPSKRVGCHLAVVFEPPVDPHSISPSSSSPRFSSTRPRLIFPGVCHRSPRR
jgi:hypothetical protein